MSRVWDAAPTLFMEAPVKTLLADAFERLVIILLSAPFVIAIARSVPSHPYWILLGLSEGLAIILILIRKPAGMTLGLYPWVIGFAGTALPLFIRPAESAALVPAVVSTSAMLAWLSLNIAAKLFLNRSFGMVAANRGVKRGGPYRIIRHPMYLGYMATQLGFLLSSFSLTNLAFYLTAWIFQILRIIEEERFLSPDPEYRSYQERVRYRLVPGLI